MRRRVIIGLLAVVLTAGAPAFNMPCDCTKIWRAHPEHLALPKDNLSSRRARILAWRHYPHEVVTRLPYKAALS